MHKSCYAMAPTEHCGSKCVAMDFEIVGSCCEFLVPGLL